MGSVWRTVLAYPAFHLVSRAPILAEGVVGCGVVLLLGEQGMPLPASLAVLALGLLGIVAVDQATSAPLLPTSDGGRRTVGDACWEAADRIADWADWNTSHPTNASDRH